MPEYRISPDQGECWEGHPAHLMPYTGATASDILRTCDGSGHHGGEPWTSAVLLDVYVGPIGVEAFHEATAALVALIEYHEAARCVERFRRPCPGVEVCVTNEAHALRAIQAALDPLPRDPAMPCCGRRESELHTADCPSALAQDAADGCPYAEEHVCRP